MATSMYVVYKAKRLVHHSPFCSVSVDLDQY